jgi:hypothetical protein
VKTLIREMTKKYRSFSLRYLLFEECDKFSDEIQFSLLIELRNKKKNDFIIVHNFTSNRTDAEKILKKLHAGKVTPIGLPYIIEDYVISQYLVNK